MNEQNKQRLFTDFPTLFKPEKGPQETLMCFGFECGDGWFDLLYKLCKDLQSLDPPAGFEIVQVKEKFGGLRVYASIGTDAIFDAIYAAESQSYAICERCGANAPEGARAVQGWLTTLCENCRTN